MTEAEWWLTCSDFKSMWRVFVPRTTPRKLRLFGVACCRRILRLLPPQTSNSLDVIEQAIDGAATLDDLVGIDREISEIQIAAKDEATREACLAVLYATSTYAFSETAEWAADHAARACWLEGAKEGRSNLRSQYAVDEDERQAQTNLIREVLPNPFRRLPVLGPVLRWNDNYVPSLAQTIYDCRDFSLTPTLADVLEDAGCDNADILDHCRQPGEHARGCWVVDLLLGKS